MIYEEGSAKVNILKKDVPTRKDEVFLNDNKSFDRDIHLLLIKSLGWKKKSYLDLFSASGIRGIRIANESNCFSRVIMNDLKKSAVNNIKKNILLNNAKNCEVLNLDAGELLRNNDLGGIDAIDIDPFGSPIYFVADAMKKLSRGGILSVCATDTGALSGTFPKTCKRRYHSNSYLSEFYYESGIRILIKEIINIASSYDVALQPIFSHATRHYFRAYFRKVKGANEADKLIKQIDYISYCPKCLSREIGIKEVCECSEKRVLIGPLFVGKLFDGELVAKMKSFEEHPDFFEKIAEESEANVPWFYTTDSVCKRHKLRIEPRIAKLGYARTHINPKGFKTQESIDEIVKKFKKIN